MRSDINNTSLKQENEEGKVTHSQNIRNYFDFDHIHFINTQKHLDIFLLLFKYGYFNTFLIKTILLKEGEKSEDTSAGKENENGKVGTCIIT